MPQNSHHHADGKGLTVSRRKPSQDFSAFSGDPLLPVLRGAADMAMRSAKNTASQTDGTEPSSASRPKRDPEAVHRKMLQAAGGCSDNGTGRPKPRDAAATREHGVGLTLRELEENRWNVSPRVAREKLLGFGLPYEGRRAGLIYSWDSIFRAEGISPEFVRAANPENCPDLYCDLLDTSVAASLLGYQDPSSIRKLVMSGDIPGSAYITFGSRGIYRFRPGSLMGLRKASSVGRIV